MIKKINVLTVIILIVLSLTACENFSIPTTKDSDTTTLNSSSETTSSHTGDTTVSTISTQKTSSTTIAHSYTLVSSEEGTYSYSCIDDETITYSFTLSVEGTKNVEVSDTTITFNEITEDTVASISGEFYGNIVIDTKDNFSFELELMGFTLTSETEVPILINNECAISAKKSTENYIYDLRSEVTSDDDISASVYSYADLDIKGKGTLYIKSNNNNGIHAKDDLEVKNLTLQVECVDNAIKGNDSVTITSGKITLISSMGDCIKTSNSHVSSKGKQKGDVTITSGTITLYSACDAIDAAHDVIINEEEGSVDLKIYTDKYSPYSKEVTTTSESSDNVIYIKYQGTTYKYSMLFSNGTDTIWKNSSSYEYKNSVYYYPIEIPDGYTKFKFYIYSSSQSQGQEDDYVVCTSDYTALNDYYDTIQVQYRNGSFSLGWTSSTQSSYGPGGGYGGPGGQGGGGNEGNSDKGDYSTKGIKADNEINISAGTIYIKAYDDAIHTNSDTQLGEEGAYYYGTGNIVISGGNIEVYSNDDGIHADGTLSIKGGTINITNSYEGLEGQSITIDDGNISIVSKDDGMNSVATTGAGITINDGTIYVYAGGDGIDSNSRTSYQGFVFNGGYTVVISTSSGNSSLDTENGYTYNGGYVIAIGPSGGMSSESKNGKNFSTYSTTKTISLSKGAIVKVDDLAYIKMPVSLSSLVIVLGKTSASISTITSTSAELDSNGVWFNR